MKSKVSMTDYIGCYSMSSGPVGHSLKVINDYIRYFHDNLEIEVLAPEGYLPYIKASKKLALPKYTDAERSGKGAWQNIKEMLQSFKNINYALKNASSEIVWFYNVDQFLFMYLFFFGFHGKKLIITLFAREYPKAYHNFCMRKVLPKIGLVISSNPEFAAERCRSIYMPDYLYDADIYDKYCENKKEKRIVCVGTMNASKRILELVSAFRENNIPLEIYGLFYDQQYYQQVLEKCTENIKIENRYLDYEEYLEVLGSSQYCVLPYNMEAYGNFTSGVLLECMYLKTIPITDARLLSRMCINGMGYQTIEELGKMELDDGKRKQILEANQKLISDCYSAGQCRGKIERAINGIGGQSARHVEE